MCRGNAIGSVVPVLWENNAPATGLTDTYLRVRRNSSDLPAGVPAFENVIERVRLVRVDRDVLVGEPV